MPEIAGLRYVLPRLLALPEDKTTVAQRAAWTKTLADMPAGPVMARIDRELPAGKIGLCSVEAGRGESHHYVLTGAENRPERWRVRAPTYQNLQAVGVMIAGQQLADVPICIGSFDPCFSCTERVETLDVNTNRVRVYTKEDLHTISRRKTPR